MKRITQLNHTFLPELRVNTASTFLTRKRLTLTHAFAGQVVEVREVSAVRAQVSRNAKPVPKDACLISLTLGFAVATNPTLVYASGNPFSDAYANVSSAACLHKGVRNKLNSSTDETLASLTSRRLHLSTCVAGARLDGRAS